jgi:hypothetical protein
VKRSFANMTGLVRLGVFMQQKRYLAFAVAAVCASSALAAPPSFHSNTCVVKFDGTRIGTDLTPGNSSLRNTFAYERATRLWHFWGFIADDANFPSAASSLRAIVHATSADAVHFTSDRNLSYAFGSADYRSAGAAVDPPLDFFRAAFDSATGTWKMFNWTENVGSSVGAYNYNTSVNDLGTLASTTAVTHQGPLNSPYSGNHVGTFGLVDGILYLRVDSATGGNGEFMYSDGIQPSTGNEIGEADLYAGTPYCWFIASGCGSSDPRKPAYVYNVGRTLRQADGSIGTYYTFRDAATAARLDRQIWYVESADNGATWSAPAGIFADGNAVTIDSQPLDADIGAANFAGIDVAVQGHGYRAFFSTQDAAGNFVMVSTPGSASDAIFFDSFEGCNE